MVHNIVVQVDALDTNIDLSPRLKIQANKELYLFLVASS